MRKCAASYAQIDYIRCRKHNFAYVEFFPPLILLYFPNFANNIIYVNYRGERVPDVVAM